MPRPPFCFWLGLLACGTAAGEGAEANEDTVSSGASSSGGSASSSGGSASGSAATLEGSTWPMACQTYCMTDADCCAELGLGSGCPSRFPDRALCAIQPENGLDHVCRATRSGCLDDMECQMVNPNLICAENTPQWCDELCPGLNTCVHRACSDDTDCEVGDVYLLNGECAHPCANGDDCDGREACQGGVYAGDPRAICIIAPNAESADPPVQGSVECSTDADCHDSDNGPRCSAMHGQCGCASDEDCSTTERCR